MNQEEVKFDSKSLREFEKIEKKVRGKWAQKSMESKYL
jgi:hypothetical protein